MAPVAGSWWRRLRRTLRVSARITAVNLRANLAYRGEFLLMIAVGAMWQVSTLVFASVLLVRFPGLGGWPSRDVLLIAGMRLLSHGLYVTFFGGLGSLPAILAEGRLEGYLMRPLPVYRQVLLAEVRVNAIGDLLVAVTLFATALSWVDVHWTPVRIGYLAAGVLGGMFVEAAITTGLSAAALHFPFVHYWTTWTEELVGTLGNYPLNILPAGMAGVLTFGFPLAFIAYLPAAVLTGHTNVIGVWAIVADFSPLAGPVAFVAARLLWWASLRRYQGIG